MKDLTILTNLKFLISELSLTQSIIEKKRILKRYIKLKNILLLIYNKNYMFNITGDKILEYYETQYRSSKKSNFSFDLLILLDSLNRRKVGGIFALDCCCEFIDEYPNFIETIVKIFNKDLRCGINSKIINDVYKTKINNFKVPLANDYKFHLCNFTREDWYISRKLDGVRCICIIDFDEIHFYSRNGKEFFTLNELKKGLKILTQGIQRIVFDGEICSLDSDGNDNFKDIMSKIRRKDYTIEDPVYHVFDYFTIDNFNKNDDFLDFEVKYKNLQSMFLKVCLNHIRLLQQRKVLSPQDFYETLNNKPEHWEGFMLRKNSPSLFKRSNNLLKVKQFKEKEFIVIGTTNGNKQIYGSIQDCCSSIEVKHKNNILSIGSGLSDRQRIVWYLNPEFILGKTIVVKYFEETKNKEGKYSLRFPVLKRVYL